MNKNSKKIMKKKVTFSGGFHNCQAITLHMNFKEEAFEDYIEHRIGLKEFIDDNLTSYQRKRLDRHFCGIKGCTCCGWRRAEIEIQN